MPANLEPIGALAQMVGMMDGPTRQPQHLAFEFAEHQELVRGNALCAVVHPVSRLVMVRCRASMCRHSSRHFAAAKLAEGGSIWRCIPPGGGSPLATRVASSGARGSAELE